MVLEQSEEQEEGIRCKSKKLLNSINTAPAHVDRLGSYLEGQDCASLCEKILLKHFNPKEVVL